ncbi:MAG TPA: type I-B CRISPR-associated protein Cas7/Cst2/DevR [bacterium]|nr:type I-B CRISPR-associated protein Cas7/Cst2/DevR [bacterium]
MSLHVFASIITPFGTAANNRSETEGNITTLQKLIWQGQTHSTVSAEAIRFALRRLLAQAEEEGTNRVFNEDTRINEWHDREFKRWEDSSKETPYIDDDLLGFMSAEAAKNEGESGTANVRRAVLEVTRAISLNPWYGDFTFNAASPAATPSAAKNGDNPVPYGTEVHATRYQYGLAMTPERLRDPSRAAKALRAIGHLRTVAGNHGRFLYDFSPDAIILRITDDPAPRLLYCFDTDDDGKTFHARSLLSRIDVGDVLANELILGVSDLSWKIAEDFKEKGVAVMGVKAAIEKACKDLDSKLSIAG